MATHRTLVDSYLAALARLPLRQQAKPAPSAPSKPPPQPPAQAAK